MNPPNDPSFDGTPLLADVGEKAFLAEVLPRLAVDQRFLNGFGDDTSMLDIGLGKQGLVVKIDRAPSPIATRNGWADARVWGRLAFVAVMSDLLASGSTPIGFMLGANVPATWPAKDLSLVIEEVGRCCTAAEVAFLGGDTKESPTTTFVGTGVGLVPIDRFARRKGARVGDVVVVAGALGGFMGAYLLLREGDGPIDDDLVGLTSEPRARWAEARALAASASPVSAATDLSDGLFDGLESLTRNGVGVEVNVEALPYHPAAERCADELDLPLLNLALCVGDWSILYAMPEADLVALVEAQPDLALAAVGRVVERPGIRARHGGELASLVGFRNEQFVARMEDEQLYMDRVRSHVALHPLDGAG